MSPTMKRTAQSGRTLRACLVIWYLLAMFETSAQAIDPQRWQRVGAKPADEKPVDPSRQLPAGVQTAAKPFGKAQIAKSPDGGTATPSVNENDKTVRLYYVSKTWADILQDVATKTGSTLVMHDAPPGRWSHQGIEKLSRADAVTVLNRELEPIGYRILAKGDFLTVIEMRRARTDYRRPMYPPDRSQGAAQVAARTPVEATPARERKFDTITPRPASSGIAQAGGTDARNRNIRPAQFTSEEEATADGIQLAQVTQPAPAQAQPAPAAQPEPEAAHPMEDQTVSITPKKRLAVDLAKQLFKAFESRAELVKAGPQGLPAFRVFHPAPKEDMTPGARGPQWFVMEIDPDRNTLWVHGDARAVKSLPVLVERLDQTAAPQGEATKVMAGEGQLKGVADQLKPELDKLLEARQQGAAPQAAQTHPLDPNAPAVQPAPQAPGELPAANPRDLQSLLGNLKGEVVVESLGDLDVLIIRGGEKDVDAVMNVIKAIERVAQGTSPGIHLALLNHVDSESLAALLTEVYEQLKTLKEQTTSSAQKGKSVSVVAVSKPNAVLVLAPPALLDGVLQLIDELDQPVDPATEVEIFRLKHAIAAQVVTSLESFYETRVGLGTKISIVADARTNSIIVQAKPNELSEVAALIKKIDRADSGAVSRVHRIKLNYAVADELAVFLFQALQGAIAPATAPTTTQNAFGGGQGANGNTQVPQELRDSKSVVLEFLARSDAADKLVRSGMLSDIRIHPEVRTNTLIITAPQQSLPFLEELVAILDQPPAAVASIKVFTLKNSDAAAAVTLLQSIFSANQNQQGQGAQNQQVGPQIAGAEDPSSTLIPLKFGTDARTNSVVAIGGAEALNVVESILLRIDQGDMRNRKSTVLKLLNSPAADVANSINQFLQSQRELTQLDPGRISTSEILEQEIIVTAEPISNSLLISATPRYYDEILRIAKDLDKEPAQVVIQALLVEVELENTDEFGVELGFQDKVLFKRSAIDNIQTISQTVTALNGSQTTSQQIISQSATPGFFFNNQALGNNPAINSSQVGKQGLSNFAVGRTNNDLGFGGLVLSASSEAVSVLIRALAAKRNVRVLSRPQVIAVDNQIAQIQVGQQVPIVNGVQIGATGLANPQIIQDQAGIILTVTPRISPEGQIVMEVAAEKSAFQGAGVPIFTDATTGNTITSPIKDITTARSTVKVPDGQTIVVGGMITASEDVIERKVPWLGDVPILGHAFRFDSITNRRTELLIFLTPRIIHCPDDMEFIKQVETERMHFLIDEAEAIHGPLLASPADAFPVEEPPFQPIPQAPAVVPLDEGMPLPTAPAAPLQRVPSQAPAPNVPPSLHSVPKTSTTGVPR